MRAQTSEQGSAQGSARRKGKGPRLWEGARSARLLQTPTCVGWSDHDYMGLCLTLAREAAARGEVPVGAVVVHTHPETGEQRLIGRGYNLREERQDPTAHAELEALRAASAVVGRWRLDECALFVTLEPCAMCAGALVNARVRRVVYGADDAKAGATRSLYALLEDPRLNHRAAVVPGVRAEECADVLRAFFAVRRGR
jgi:tRNA(adenine34) deaminase